MNKTRRNQKGFSFVELVIILLVVAIVGVAGSIVYKDNQKKASANAALSSIRLGSAQTSFSLPSGWSWYHNTEYSFKLAYPNIWGSPQLTQTSGDTGASYAVDFTPGPSYDSLDGPTLSRNSISVYFNSVDYSFTSTNDANITSTQGAYATQAMIQQTLDRIQDGTYPKTYLPVVAYNENSYDTINTGNAHDSTDYLEMDQIISLPKINVNGALGQYSIADSGSCPQNKIAPNTQKWCINQNVVDTMTKVMDSIEPI